ncbi:MAG: U32 family peptidase [Leptospirales bacterium]|nr:U32 family peptidase [Leptospirales bacterium]
MRKIELLAPAKNIETGIAAINFGADALYIGPQKFSARINASNSIKDIAALIKYSHKYSAKVYGAVNTILFDNELEEAETLIRELYNIGIDGIIIQDMAILEMNLPPIPIHASTQTDNLDLARIKFFDKIGFSRIILGRELTIEEIKTVRENVECGLELFIHGALCVSLSGRCYMSASIGGRSANRGECAQPCRKSYTLHDINGKTIGKNYQLSLKDMNRTKSLKDIIDAGVDSLKIEGRLKDINYVKNITAHYRKELDKILEGRSDLTKGSSGRVYFDFTPDPVKTFNRGYTGYFLDNRTESITSPDTPKSIGERIGKITEVNENWFKVPGNKRLNNGDGIIIINKGLPIEGVKINRIDDGKIYPLIMKDIKKGGEIYRNSDTEFEKKLAQSRTMQKIRVSMKFKDTNNGFMLTITDEDNYETSAETVLEKKISSREPDDFQQIKKHLSKLGATIFEPDEIKISLSKNYFLQVSILNDLRRRAVENLLGLRISSRVEYPSYIKKTDIPYPYKKIDFTHNVSNRLAYQFYKRHGVEEIENSFETSGADIKGPLMTTKLCLRYENSLCKKENNTNNKFQEPLYLSDENRKYRIEFDCKNCFMLIYKE